MTIQRCTMTDNTVTFNESFSFDLQDKKGRAIGLQVKVIRRTLELDDKGTYVVNRDLGTEYLVFAQKLVAGKQFGASQSATAFKTALAAMQYVVKVIDARKAAYTKQHGGEA
jgi:hypothetical protein